MANFRSIYKVQLFLTILIHLALAIYEDQVGKFDWRRSFVGKVKFVSLEAKRIIVATEENVLASLNLTNGEIQWRQVLEDTNQVQIELMHVNKEILTVSGRGDTWLVRTWELNSGTLFTEWPIYTNNTGTSTFTVSNSKLLHIIPIPKSHIEIISYPLINFDKSNPKEATKKLTAPWIHENTNCIAVKNYYVCIDSNILYYANLLEENPFFAFHAISDLIENDKNQYVLVDYIHEKPSVLLLNNNIAKLAVFDDEYVHVKPFDLLPNAISVKEKSNDLIYQLESTERSSQPIRVKAKDYSTGADRYYVDLDYPPGIGAPVILGIQWTGSATNLLISTTDMALLLVEMPRGKIVWSREESLSHVVASEFLELPISPLDVSIEHEFDEDSDILSMFIHRISTQSRQLYNLLLGNRYFQNSGLIRDEFGIHKIIVVATKAGKLFGIDTLSGAIVWSYRLPNVQPFLGINNKEKMLLFVQRTSQYAPLPAQCVLLAQDTVTGNGIILQFDPITGNSFRGIQRFDYKISQATVLPQHDKNFLKLILILSEDKQAFIYPPNSNSILKDHFSTTFFYTVDAASSTFNGYTLKYSDEDNLRITPTWEVNLGPSEIVEFSAKLINERVHSQGKVLFDRSVYYKYVNPNLLAVATVSADQMYNSVVSIYLIDGVTGLVIYSASHKRATGPVYLVHSENWLLYTYFNERFRRTEATALELYEGHVQSNSTVFSSFSVSQLPIIQSQSYILPTIPILMAVTLTEKGITNKHLLVAFTNGAVFELPWMTFQPRFAGMACGPEESCIPYRPETLLHPETIINYNQTLLRIRGIQSAPARLESTSHIFVYGLDIFYTRVAPSKTFDLLKEDFDYRLIALVLIGLIVTSVVAKQLAARKALKHAWK